MSPELICLEIAREQYGLITLAQALEAGLSRHAIYRRVRSGRWRLVAPQVFAINGLPETYRQRLLAYVLAAAPAAASHRAAAHLYGLRGCEQEIVEITTATSKRFGRVRVHEDLRLEDDRLRTIDGIRVTSVERTLMDLAAVMREQRFEVALDDALARRLTTLGRLNDLLDQRAVQGRNGVQVFRKLLRLRAGWLRFPEAIDETHALRVLRSHPGLPEPVVQHRVFDRSGRHLARIDITYPDADVFIEIHSMRYHSSRQDLEKDARRQNRLMAKGYIILIYTRRDIEERPREMADEIHEAYRASLRSRRGFFP